MNLYEKINEIRKKVDYIQKDKSVSTGGGSYKAVTHDAVTGILREHLIAHGIICIPNLVKSESHAKEEGAKQFRYDATYSFDFVNAETPAEKLTIIIEAHAMDNADKAPGKAISYAKKYAVLKLFEIETGEDEESRYQPLDVDADALVEMINSASTINELKDFFRTCAQDCGSDKEALRKVIAAKDAKKKVLDGTKN
jgi:hypothetical protein